MATRRLVIFQHESELGNAPSHLLFDLVKVVRNPAANPPRSFADYAVSIDKSVAPAGVTIIEKI
jgi:CRISPR-associated protein Csd2